MLIGPDCAIARASCMLESAKHSVLLLAVLALPATPSRGVAAGGIGVVDFNRDIRPILSDNCYQCHGPDEKARKAKLRLDTKEGAFRLKEDKAVILPGKSAESELIRRVTNTDPDEVMPPPKSKPKLMPAQVDLLKRWGEQGA